MHQLSDLIRLSKDAHIKSTGRIPAHVYIPTWVRDRLQREVYNLSYMLGTDLADATITHIHGLQIHTLAAFDHTDIVCSVTEEPA